MNKHVLKTRLPSRQMLEFRSRALHGSEQRGNGLVRFVDRQRPGIFVPMYGLDPRQHAPERIVSDAVAHRELDHVMTAEPLDQLARRAFRYHLAVIDDSHAVAQSLG